jgi:alcohol dehydrogenase YqhD (iron-dependent ADH family)
MNPYFEGEFKKRLYEMVERREEVILKGIDNSSQYFQTVGVRQGLLAAWELFKDIYEKTEME